MRNDSYLIVVGVDGSEGGRNALRWAVHQAHLRGGSVQAVNAWQGKPAEKLLAREVEGLPLYQLSGIPIACEAVEGRPAEVLVTAARDADLLVLGSHGHSRQVHQVLGSVTEECIRNATCPVVVLPTGYQHRDAHNSGGQLAEVQ